jgi:hypothetical protein
MPAKATAELLARFDALPAVGQRSPSETRQRPRQARLTHAERFDGLTTKAGFERGHFLDRSRESVGDVACQGRPGDARPPHVVRLGLCRAKQQRLRPPPTKRAVPLLLGGPCPQIRTVIGPWTTDANGIMTREIFGVDASAP